MSLPTAAALSLSPFQWSFIPPGASRSMKMWAARASADARAAIGGFVRTWIPLGQRSHSRPFSKKTGLSASPAIARGNAGTAWSTTRIDHRIDGENPARSNKSIQTESTRPRGRTQTKGLPHLCGTALSIVVGQQSSSEAIDGNHLCEGPKAPLDLNSRQSGSRSLFSPINCSFSAAVRAVGTPKALFQAPETP